MTSEPERAVTDEEIKAYRRDGAVCLRGIMPGEWVDLVRSGLEEVRADPGPMGQDVIEPNGARMLAVQCAALRNETLWRYVVDSPAAAIAGATHGASQLQYHLDQVFYKDAGPVRQSEWHQDTPYFNVSGADVVRVWLPCDPAPRQIALEFVRGSHKWNVTYQTNIPEIAKVEGPADGFTYGEMTDDVALPPFPDIVGNADSFDIIGWDVDPGDVIVFNGHVIHGAGAADHHPTARRALAVMYAGAQERFVSRPGRPVPDVAAINGAELRHGDRLRDHPDIYPVVWKA